jgi:hypothetical protein
MKVPSYLKEALGKLGKTPKDLSEPVKESLMDVMGGVKRIEDKALMAEMFLRKHFRMKELTIEDVANLKKMGKAMDRAFEYSMGLVNSWRTAVIDHYEDLKDKISEKEALVKIKGIASKQELKKWRKI